MARDVISILDFTRDDLELLFRTADDVGRGGRPLEGYVMATAFFEPSTRTKLSFHAAMQRLGGSVIDLPPDVASSRAKGENLADTVRMLDAYADVIVIRHRLEGAARYAAEIAESPVINGGDGTRDHPTQAMTDLYTILKERGRIDGLVVGVLGDLRYGRAARSFILGVIKYEIEGLHLIAPEPLRCREETLEHIRASGVRYREHSDLAAAIGELDVLYVTRIQRERFPDPLEYERVRGSYRVTRESLRGAKEDIIILHPLPRVDELDFSVDATPHARYFRQAAYGVPVRMALLKLLLVGEWA